MKQAILLKPGSIEIREVPVPVPGDGEVLVKIHSALTCGTDLKAYTRGHGLIPMPGPFGHEYSGTVAAVGGGVSTFKEGDPVMGVHSAPCGACRYCRKGLFNLCEVIMEKKALGAFAGYLIIPGAVVKQNLFPKPPDLPFEHAALLEPLSCVVHPYGSLNRDKPETALVLGAGPIGLLHLAYLRMLGIRTIISDISLGRLAAAEKMGGLIAGPGSLEQVVHENTEGLGVDLVLECTGLPDVWEKSVHYVRRGGSVVLFGGCPSGTGVRFDTHRLHYDEVSGSFHFTPADVRLARQVLEERKLDLSVMISGEFPLDNLPEALKLLEKGEGIKYAIRP